MLRPVLRPDRAHTLAHPKPGRIERRSEWTRLVDGNLPLGPCALEILTCTKKPGLAGLVRDHGHAWIRIWRNEKDYVSLGFYPDESTGLDPEDRPGLRMPGMLLTPDKYDPLDWPRRATKHPISKDQYCDLITWIETKQAERLDGALAFDLVDRNCVGFVVEAAKRCGITVEAEQALLGFLPIGAPKLLDRLTRPLRAVFYRAGVAVFGGCAVMNIQYQRANGSIEAARIQGISPIFSHVTDLFRPLPFYHVRALQRWQDRQLRRVENPAQTALREAPS